MKILVITHPDKIEDEAEKIIQLFRDGLEILHLRKPDWDLEKYEHLLKQIPPQYYRRIVIHSHFKLIEKYNLKGVHLKSQYLSVANETALKDVFRLASKKNVTISASMHSFQELRENKWKFDYIFLSPVFDSISKKGHQSGFESEELIEFLKQYTSSTLIIGLGGIDENNIEKVASYGFAGAALLGAVWKDEESKDKFRNIKKLVEV
jgi:thiamine-phosphate pyrophosphorylase